MNQTATTIRTDIAQDISIEALHAQWRNLEPGALIVDIRSPEDYHAGHVPGSRNIPFASVMERSAELRDCSRVFIYCYGGQGSASVAAQLAQAGFEHLYYVGQAGMKDWQANGYPVEA